MLNKDELTQGLRAAAGAGLIEDSKVDPLADFLAARKTDNSAAGSNVIPGEEDLRFVRNFHDVFLATGIVLLSVGLAVTVGVLTENSKGAELPIAMAALLSSAGVMWCLGEIFSRKRRLFLPSIAICVSFALFVIFGVMAGYALIVGEHANPFDAGFDKAGMAARASAPVCALAGLLACAAFYARFRLPFSMGLIGSMAVLTLIAFVFWQSPTLLEHASSILILGGGLAMFGAGVWFDARDPSRATRISDNGFWLHMGAAPMILHGVLSMVGGGVGQISRNYGEETNLTAALVTLAVVALLGLASLLINRRALIVSALVTTGVAVGAVMKAVGIEAGGLAAITFVALGGGVLILGAGWHKIRAILLRHVPSTGVWARIFPPEESLESGPASVASA